MKITESNYEEYFLLYVDDELTGTERSAVEAFIQQHPQFAAELKVLQQATLSNEDTISFASKTVLYKTEENEIGTNNYEDYFLRYTDNELSEEDKANTERFVLQHPQLQTEFTLLQQTKLQPEKIEFAGKEKLYKKEKGRRVIPLYLTRITAAAALITLIVLGWQLSPHKNNTEEVIVKTTAPPEQPITRPSLNKNPLTENKNTQPFAEASQSIVTTPRNVKQPIIMQGDEHVATVQLNNKKEATPDITITKVPNVQDAPTAPAPIEIAMRKQPVVEVSQQAEVLKPLQEVDTDEISTQTVSVLSSDDNMAQPAVYKELNTQEDNHSLYVGAFQLNKAKVNGFLKSASHLLGNKTKGVSD